METVLPVAGSPLSTDATHPPHRDSSSEPVSGMGFSLVAPLTALTRDSPLDLGYLSCVWVGPSVSGKNQHLCRAPSSLAPGKMAAALKTL